MAPHPDPPTPQELSSESNTAAGESLNGKSKTVMFQRISQLTVKKHMLWAKQSSST